MSNTELIEGRNLLTHGEFSDGWQTSWVVEGTHQVREDSATGKTYLQIYNGATAQCSIDLPVRPDTDAVYWFSFSYEGIGSKPSNVTIKEDGGNVIFDESFMTRLEPGAEREAPSPLADFRPYPPKDLEGLERKNVRVDLIVTAASGGSREGINITDFKMDLRLAPLELTALSLDGRQIPVAPLSQPTFS